MQHSIVRRRSSVLAGIFTVCLLISLAVLTGCGGGGSANTAVPDLTGTITGSLYTSVDGQSLSTKRATGSVPAGGAEVRVQGTSIRTLTNSEGRFTLSGVPAGLQHVIIAYAGYQVLDVPVTVEAGRTVLLEATETAPVAPRKWTVLVYLNADNDLEPYAIQDLNEMEAAIGGNDVAVIAQVDRSPDFDDTNGNWTDTRRLRILHDDDLKTITSPVLENMGEVDMGDAQSAQDFLAWGQRQYPAEHYLFIFWNHGTGWRSLSTATAITRGISYDFTSGTKITIPELPGALASPAPLDIVAFDACLMQMFEIGYELRNSCRYAVASEEDVPAEGYDYRRWLAPLVQSPTMPPAELAATMQRTAWETFSSRYAFVTYSVLDTGELAALATAVDRFGGTLVEAARIYPAQLAAARNEAESFADPEYKDLYHYAALVKAKVPAAAVRDAATAVMTAVEQAVTAEYHVTGHPNAHGLSIFVPSPAGYATAAKTYAALASSQQTRWDEWLAVQQQ